MSVVATGLTLFSVAMLAGIINAVAGGGAFLTFPALMLAGLPGIAANATSNAAMWFGTAASATGYHNELRLTRAVTMRLVLASSLGSLVGAVLVLVTPETAFLRAVPFLLLAATVLFICGPTLNRRRGPQQDELALPVWVMPVQFILGIYGGYFGAGVGIATLAVLGQIGFTRIHQMNGIKTLLTACMNGVACIPFALAGAIVWHWALVMCCGAVIGGYLGARVARKASPRLIWWTVVVVAVGMTMYFFWKTFGAVRGGA